MNYAAILHQEPVFALLASAVKEQEVEAYVIGGYVRDLLLERPCKDIDVVCVGSGIELARKVAGLMGEEVHVTTFKNFGTAMLKYGDWEVEFVGARKESYNRDSRKPVVEDGTLEDDQRRRDFTINALALSLNEKSFGELVDPFGGVEDLKKKVIRTPLEPDTTFSDDPLRMMRAIRFASQLKFDIAPDTFDSISKNKERLEIVSMERITTELNKIILSPQPSYGFKLLYHAGILQQIFPELTALQGVETIENKSHKDNFYHTLQVLDNICKETDDLWVRWAAILHDIAKPATKRYHPKAGWSFHGHEEKGARMVPNIFRRMKLPMNESMRKVQNLVRLHLRPIALVKDEVTDSAVRRLLVDASDDFEDLMKLCRADITSKNNNKVQRFLENFKKVEAKVVDLEARDSLRNFQPVVTGEDIMKAFNLEPGKTVGDIKAILREAILEGEVVNEFEAAFAFVVEVGEKRFGLTRKL